MFVSIISTLVLGSLIGSIVSVSVFGFLNFIKLLTNLFRNPENSFISFNEFFENPFDFIFFIFIIPFFVGLLVGYIRKFTNDKRWHGPPDVILSVHTKNNPLNIKTGFLTSLSSIFSISAGGSVGQYGPLVHFGATLGAEIKQFFYKTGDYQIFIGAGVAAAISSGFGAPIAGLVFAREVVLRHQSLASFAPILVSSTVSYLITKLFFGFEQILPASIGGVNSLFEFPALVISGLVCGLVATIYMKGLTTKKNLFFASKINPVIQPALAGLLCGIIGVQIPEVIGLGTETIQKILSGNVSLMHAFYFLIIKLFLTIFCLRMGLIGGVFAPALFIGASLGVILGTFFQIVLPNSNLLLFAISSMAAVGSCVIGGPVANMLIIFELTSDYQATLAAGVSIVFASLISSKMIGQSVFDKVLKNRNIDLTIGDENLLLKDLKIKDICHKNFYILKNNENLKSAINALSKNGFSEGYLVNNENKLTNKIELHNLITLKNKKKLVSSMKKNSFLKLKDEESIYNSISLCKNFVGESIPVVSKNNEIIGVIGESDLLKIILNVSKNQKDLESKN